MGGMPTTMSESSRCCCCCCRCCCCCCCCCWRWWWRCVWLWVSEASTPEARRTTCRHASSNVRPTRTHSATVTMLQVGKSRQPMRCRHASQAPARLTLLTAVAAAAGDGKVASDCTVCPHDDISSRLSLAWVIVAEKWGVRLPLRLHGRTPRSVEWRRTRRRLCAVSACGEKPTVGSTRNQLRIVCLVSSRNTLIARVGSARTERLRGTRRCSVTVTTYRTYCCSLAVPCVTVCGTDARPVQSHYTHDSHYNQAHINSFAKRTVNVWFSLPVCIVLLQPLDIQLINWIFPIIVIIEFYVDVHTNSFRVSCCKLHVVSV